MGEIRISSIILILAIWGAYADEPLPQGSVCLGKEELVKFEVYIQDKSSGPNATVWEVARAEITSGSASSFGLVDLMDSQVTAEADPSSQEIGRLQGPVFFADMKELAVTANLNFYFTNGIYNGSTLTVLGRNPLMNDEREVPVVAGTGVFRLARGYAITTTPDKTGGSGVIKYVFYILKYPKLEHLAA
nr:dirigent protein 5 [Phryma leptostachya subsp. asiatica]